MAAFASVLIALGLTWMTLRMERSRVVSQRMSGMMLALSGIVLVAFAFINLLLVEEPVHMLPGALGALMLVGGTLRQARVHFRLRGAIAAMPVLAPSARTTLSTPTRYR